MLKLVAGFFMALVLAGPALAQTAPSADYARREALARQVVSMIDPGEAMEAVLLTLPEVIANESADMSAPERAVFKSVMMTSVREALPAYMGAVIDAMVPLYAESFTVAELEAMLEFYGTPEGASILKKSVTLGVDAQRLSMDLLPGFMEDMAVSVCRQLDCDPAEFLAGVR
mgnify:CR=1 FL=1